MTYNPREPWLVAPSLRIPACIAGFTGTASRRLTNNQILGVRRAIIELGITEFHHGDCINADEHAHEIAIELGVPVVLHPPLNHSKRAFCKGAVLEMPPRPYIERNHDIVDVCHFLLVAPKTSQEELRSGTWATYRYAERTYKPIRGLLPNKGDSLIRLPTTSTISLPER